MQLLKMYYQGFHRHSFLNINIAAVEYSSFMSSKCHHVMAIQSNGGCRVTGMKWSQIQYLTNYEKLCTHTLGGHCW